MQVNTLNSFNQLNAPMSNGGELRVAKMGAGTVSEAVEEGREMSLRERVMRARAEREKSGKSGAVSGVAKSGMEQQASNMTLNWLWALTASVVGFIPGVLGLNALAFLKTIGVTDKIKFRTMDSVGLLAVDLLLFFLVLGVLAFFVMIVNFIQHPLDSSVAFMRLGWSSVGSLANLLFMGK